MGRLTSTRFSSRLHYSSTSVQADLDFTIGEGHKKKILCSKPLFLFTGSLNLISTILGTKTSTTVPHVTMSSDGRRWRVKTRKEGSREVVLHKMEKGTGSDEQGIISTKTDKRFHLNLSGFEATHILYSVTIRTEITHRREKVSGLVTRFLTILQQVT